MFLGLMNLYVGCGGFLLFGRRAAFLWVVTGLVVGSLNALLLDRIREDVLYLAYDGLVGGWLLLLTAISSTYIKERK